MSEHHRFKDELKAIWQLGWPIMVGQLASTGTAFVDAVMAGHVSADDLAAVSIGASVWVMLLVTLIGLTLAASPLIAHAVGANERQRIPGIAQQALYQGLLWGVLALLAARLALPVFDLLNLAPDVAHKAREFLKAIAWALPAFALFRVLYGYSASLNATKPMMVIALIGLAVNVPANYVLIYGHLGFPAMGAIGCGWASAFGIWLTLLLMLAWLHVSPAYRDTFPLRHWQRIDWQQQWQLLKLGLPMGAMFFVEVSAFSGLSLLIAKLGTVAVAAHQIALNMASLMFMIPSGLGTAMTVRVGQALGAGETAYARFIGWTGIRIGLVVAASTMLFMVLGRHWIASWYTQDGAVLAAAGTLVLLAGIFQLADATQVIAAGVLRGYKVTRRPMQIHLAAFWVIGIPGGYLLAFNAGLGAAGFWIALVLALAFAAGALVWLFHKRSKAALAG
ncbi:multidrug resistance protein, MATE family [Andreprevotia lacus DSM 23236]|jgi:MATE family multidrug resistance protein|uniref:Multidrug-efflux transporter n=1 Tax=Andreprevotia lacus DSM 23236 TaxID=1121001 RepID=A0A1W1XTJ5_9NEIS|nr:MATE family efflux transporter [Andreprevotia lacus]SMC26861.1 multidrug resistance protein, MATE family [Andreprevotia lacus DSM 23236]